MELRGTVSGGASVDRFSAPVEPDDDGRRASPREIRRRPAASAPHVDDGPSGEHLASEHVQEHLDRVAPRFVFRFERHLGAVVVAVVHEDESLRREEAGQRVVVAVVARTCGPVREQQPSQTFERFDSPPRSQLPLPEQTLALERIHDQRRQILDAVEFDPAIAIVARHDLDLPVPGAPIERPGAARPADREHPPQRVFRRRRHGRRQPALEELAWMKACGHSSLGGWTVARPRFAVNAT